MDDFLEEPSAIFEGIETAAHCIWFTIKKIPTHRRDFFVNIVFINLRLSCFLRKLSRVLFERLLELVRILHIPL